jgi:hypothetical protein
MKLLAQGHQIAITRHTLFELEANGAKHVANGALKPERVARIIRAITHDDTIKTINSTTETKILLTAFKLRKTLNDFINCIITSATTNHCDALITEDTDIKNLKKNKDLNTLTKANPKLTIQTLTEITHSKRF